MTKKERDGLEAEMTRAIEELSGLRVTSVRQGRLLSHQHEWKTFTSKDGRYPEELGLAPTRYGALRDLLRRELCRYGTATKHWPRSNASGRVLLDVHVVTTKARLAALALGAR